MGSLSALYFWAAAPSAEMVFVISSTVMNEIIDVIDQGLPDDEELRLMYAEFCRDNRQCISTTRAQAVSYWDLAHRRRHGTEQRIFEGSRDYPGVRLIDRLCAPGP